MTLHGIEKPDEIHRYYYRHNGLVGNFYFLTNYKGHTGFHHNYIYINRRPPQSEIEQMRPVMRQIKHAIQTRCGVADLDHRVIESCHGVQCGGA